MELCIVSGRAGSGKSKYCIDSIANDIEKLNKGNVFLIVPEQFTLQAERKLLDVRGFKGLLMNEILSFRRMAFRVLSQNGGLAKNRLNPAGRVMLLEQVFEKNKDVKFFHGFNEKPWELSRVLSLFDEFGRYNIMPEKLLEISDASEISSSLNLKIKEIHLIYSEYRTLLSTNFVDECDVMKVLLDKLEEYKPFKDAEIWIDEFSGFTSVEYQIIKKIISQAKKVNVCLCMSKIFDPVFNSVFITMDKLVKLAYEMDCKIERVFMVEKEELPRFSNNQYLSHVERYFNSYPSVPKLGQPQGISLYTAKNIYAEVEACAQEIVKMCRDETYRYKEIAVVARNLENYEKIIKSVFEQYKIPFFIDIKKDIEEHPLIKMILSSIEIITGNWQYQDVFNYLKSDLQSFDENEIHLLENYVIANGIRGKSMWSKDFGELNAVKINIIEPLEGLESSFKKCNNIGDFCNSMYNFLMKLQVPEKIYSLVERYTLINESIVAQEYSRIWNIVTDVFDQIYYFLKETLTTSLTINTKHGAVAEKFLNLIKSGLSQYKMGFIPYSADSIFVGSVERSRNHEIKALFLLGANEGVFPGTFSEDGLLSDKERNVFKKLGIELAEDSRTRAFMEQFMVYTVLTSPSEKLRISYSLEDSGSKALRPSMIIRRICKLFPDIRVKDDLSGLANNYDILNKLVSPGPFLNEHANEICDEHNIINQNSIWQDIHFWYKNSPQWSNRYKMMMGKYSYIKNCVTLNEATTKDLFKWTDNVNISVSKIEQYNRCPFSYFLKYGIKVQPRKEKKYNLPDVGVFLHNLIEYFTREIVTSGSKFGDLTETQCAEKIENVMSEVLQSQPGTVFDSSERYRFMAKRLGKMAARSAFAISRQISSGSFVPTGFETGFGPNREFPPVSIPIKNGMKIKLEGRIDRYDILQDEEIYVRIIDYKSRIKDLSPGDVVTGMELQLMCYMDALVKGLQRRTKKIVKPAGVFYFKLDDPITRSEVPPDNEVVADISIKSFKLKGLVINDEKIVRSMDNNIGPNSEIIPVSINKDGNISGSCITNENFKLLNGKMHEIIVQSVNSIIEGDISIRPVKVSDDTPCSYCDYTSICHFDSTIPRCKYRQIKIPSDDEVWDMLKSVPKDSKEN